MNISSRADKLRRDFYKRKDRGKRLNPGPTMDERIAASYADFKAEQAKKREHDRALALQRTVNEGPLAVADRNQIGATRRHDAEMGLKKREFLFEKDKDIRDFRQLVNESDQDFWIRRNENNIKRDQLQQTTNYNNKFLDQSKTEFDRTHALNVVDKLSGDQNMLGEGGSGYDEKIFRYNQRLFTPEAKNALTRKVMGGGNSGQTATPNKGQVKLQSQPGELKPLDILPEPKPTTPSVSGGGAIETNSINQKTAGLSETEAEKKKRLALQQLLQNRAKLETGPSAGRANTMSNDLPDRFIPRKRPQ